MPHANRQGSSGGPQGPCEEYGVPSMGWQATRDFTSGEHVSIIRDTGGGPSALGPLRFLDECWWSQPHARWGFSLGEVVMSVGKS